MSNLAAAAQALKQKGPKKKYSVMFVQEETCCIEVEAVDRTQAEELASNELNHGSGNWSNNGNGPNLLQIDEL